MRVPKVSDPVQMLLEPGRFVKFYFVNGPNQNKIYVGVMCAPGDRAPYILAINEDGIHRNFDFEEIMYQLIVEKTVVITRLLFVEHDTKRTRRQKKNFAEFQKFVQFVPKQNPVKPD